MSISKEKEDEFWAGFKSMMRFESEVAVLNEDRTWFVQKVTTNHGIEPFILASVEKKYPHAVAVTMLKISGEQIG